DDHQFALVAERNDVGAAAVAEREFEEARIAELLERTANAARQQGGGGGLVGGGHGAVRRSMAPRADPDEDPQFAASGVNKKRAGSNGIVRTEIEHGVVQ